MTAHDWLAQIPGAVLGLLATILGAVVVRMLRRIYWATQEAGEHARLAGVTASSNAGALQTTALDVASLQGWARRVDRELDELRDGISTRAAEKIKVSQQLQQLEQQLQRLEQQLEQQEGSRRELAAAVDGA